MILFKLAVKNIKRSIKDYAIYFFTLVLGVAIFYVFNAIGSQTVMLNVSKSTYEIINLMINMLSGVSVFVSFILGFLIIYASRFLIKRRNKEFGIYLTLGMSKKKVSLILFIETLLIGLISLVIGLGLGTILSQFMSVLVANMFEADMTKFQFVFSTSACIKCLIYFGVMYLLVMLFNTVIINKCKLIDLLQANKKSEKVKLKNTWLCIIIFIISSITLGYAYYLVTGNVGRIESYSDILIPIILGSLSTFFLFFSLSGLVLKIVKSIKNYYYKGLNSFILRQVSSKINTMVFSMTIICLMLFVTICVLSSALSIKNSMIANLNELVPVDVQLVKAVSLSRNSGIDSIRLDGNYSTIDTLKNINYDLSNFKEYTEYKLYHSNLTFADTLGTDLDMIKSKYKFLTYDSLENIMSISDYNKIAKLYNMPTYALNDNQYMIIADYQSMINIRNISLNSGNSININGTDYIPKYDKCVDGFVDISSNHVNAGIIILPDNAVNDLELAYDGVLANYNANSKTEREKIDAELSDITGNMWNVSSYINFNSKINIANASIGLGALVTFIGLYLGIIFLISSAAILALKELSESSDNRERYMMLRKLGADDKMINRALFRQIGIFFMFPLLLAIIHSVFGIKFCVNILSMFGKEKLASSIIMTAIFLTFIYGGYFLITYLCSKNIIKE